MAVEVSLDLVNPATSVAVLLDSNVSRAMGERAAATPSNLSPDEIEWSAQSQQQLEVRSRWASHGSNLGITPESVIRLGVIWSFGGRYRGDGRYLHDAYLYCVAESTGLGQSFSASGSFSLSPDSVGNKVAVLGGTVELAWVQFGVLQRTYLYSVTVRGDGAGSIQPV